MNASAVTVTTYRPEKMAPKPSVKAQPDPLQAARKRFYLISGQGAGTRFWDAIARYEVTAHNVADWMYQRGFADKHGGFVSAAKIAAMHWQTVRPDFLFEIHGPPIVQRHGHHSVNQWWDDGVYCGEKSKFTAEQLEAEVEPFISLLRLVMCERKSAYCDDDGRVDFFVNWLRYVLQHPGSKPPTVPYTFGAQGFFKGTVLQAIAKAFGPNTVVATSEDKNLTDMNAHELFRAALLVVEEVKPDSHQGSAVYNSIKALSTTKETNTRAKHRGFSKEPTPAALWLCSNSPPPFLEEGDRRFWVVRWECTAVAELDAVLLCDDPDWISNWKNLVWREFTDWLERDEGYAKLRRYLEWVPSSFTPRDAPMTDEKRSALALSTRREILDVRSFLDNHESAAMFGYDAFDAFVHNKNQMKHLAAEVGLEYLTLADCGSDAARPELSVEGKQRVRGDTPFYIRRGWKLRKKPKGWELRDPEGQLVKLSRSVFYDEEAEL